MTARVTALRGDRAATKRPTNTTLTCPGVSRTEAIVMQSNRTETATNADVSWQLLSEVHL